MNTFPDVEAEFVFNGTRKRSIYSGYRPAHSVRPDYLTTGVHKYYEDDPINADGSVKGTITFITPEYYPHCLWLGKELTVQEGDRIVGIAKITHIYNEMLLDEKTTELLKFVENVIFVAKGERTAILKGESSAWNLEYIQRIVIPEMSEFISYINGIVNFEFDYKKNWIAFKSAALTNSSINLSHSKLGQSILRFQELYINF